MTRRLAGDEQRFGCSGCTGKEGSVKDLPYMAMFQIGATQMREPIALIGKTTPTRNGSHTQKRADEVSHPTHRYARVFVYPIIQVHHIHAALQTSAFFLFCYYILAAAPLSWMCLVRMHSINGLWSCDSVLYYTLASSCLFLHRQFRAVIYIYIYTIRYTLEVQSSHASQWAIAASDRR